MNRSLRDELQKLANDGTAADMAVNGRLALLALLVTLEKAEDVIEAARSWYEVQRGTMAANGKSGIAVRDAIAAWDAAQVQEGEEASN